MLNTSDVKSLSKGGTTVSLEEINNSIDNKLSIDNLTGSDGIKVAKNTAGDKVEVKINSEGFSIGDVDGSLNKGNYITLSTSANSHRSYFGMAYDLTEVFSIDCNDFKPTIVMRYAIVKPTDDGGLTLNAPSETPKQVLTEGNVKTLFSNQQSIYGSGNIDLYKHNISLTNTSNKNMSFQLISSNNLVVDSLTDLKTLTNEQETFAAFGQCLYNNRIEIIIGVGKAGIYSTDGTNVHTQSWASFMDRDTFYWSDTVTTI